MPRDLIPPRGRTLLHGEAGKPTSAVGVASPKAVPRRGGGLTFGRRAAATGVRAAHGGVVSAADGATFGRSGGARRAEAGAGGQKSRTRGGLPGSQGCARAPGSRAKTGAGPPFSGRSRAKPGLTRPKRGVWAASRGGLGGHWGQKSPFLPQKCWPRGCAGAKTGGKSLRGVKGYPDLFRESSGGLGGNAVGFAKPFHAHIGRKTFQPLFFVDDAPSLGAIVWWIGRVAIRAEKSDECVTPRGAHLVKRKRRQTHENPDFRHRD